MRKLLLLLLLLPAGVFAQFTSTARHIVNGSTLPTSCSLLTGDVFIKDSGGSEGVYYCSAPNTWTQLASSAGGASTALDNLASVNINTALLFQSGKDIGSTTKPPRNIFLYGSGTYGTNYFQITGTPTGARVITIPDATGTLLSSGAAWASGAFGYDFTLGTVSLDSTHVITTTAYTMSAGAKITGTSNATIAGLRIAGGDTSDVQAGAIYVNTTNSFAWANGVARTFFTNPATADRTVFIPDSNSDTLPRTATANLIAISGATAAPTWLTPGTGVITFLGLNSTTVGQILRVSSSNTYTWGALDLADSDAITGIIPIGNLPAADLTTGTSKTFSIVAGGYFECTNTCTITMPVPAAGKQYCVRNGNNVATVITFAAIGSSAMYEVQAKTSYGTAGTGTFISGGAIGDQVCFVGKDSTHYDIWSISGTWTAN